MYLTEIQNGQTWITKQIKLNASFIIKIVKKLKDNIILLL